ncbi:MAG: hypothetical protein HUJ91_02730 [Bacteroidales bacterium]|nr:hypothetical protein [Bacteroidales bacterium]
MKKTFLMMAAATGIVAAASCSKIETNAGNTDSPNVVAVQFSLSNLTKAMTSEVDDDAVNTAYVFAFDGNRLDASTSVTSATTGTIEVTPGSRRFIAVVNPNSEFSYTSVTTPQSIMNLVSNLSSEGIRDMVMVGENTVTVTESTTSVMIDVTRLVSKISVSELTFNLKGALAGKTVSNVSLYIKNYPTTSTYAGTPGTSYSSGLYPANHNSFEVYESLGSVVSGASSTTRGYQFFCYPRTTLSQTTGSGAIRLCIQGTIDGQKYYWSIPVNNGNIWTATAFENGDSHYGVKRNHSYDYAITITRAGVPDDGSQPDPTDPDDNGDPDLEDDTDLSTSDLTFTLRVVPFVEVSSQTVTF